jgi:hypothetical protein
VTRTKRSSEDLKKVSEHLSYEIRMLTSTANGLISEITNGSSLHNALLESFTIHARCLVDFLYPIANPRSDDVVAEDFAPNWRAVRPPKPPVLNKLNLEVGKQIAHLTYRRISVTEEAKGWKFKEITTVLADPHHGGPSQPPLPGGG